MNLKELIRIIPDFPTPGISFKDITTLLQNPAAFEKSISQLAERVQGLKPDLIVGPEARGFVIGAPLAYTLKTGFIPVRKKGKLPAAVVQENYQLEYGTDVLEMHSDAIRPGQKVLIVDDVLATGGTMQTVARLVEKLQGDVVGLTFLIELTYLSGRQKLEKYNITSLIQF